MKGKMLNLKEILNTLKKNNLHFILIGGQAAVVHGSAYLTHDVDVCYARDKENLENIVKALKAFNPFLRGAEKDLPFIFDAETLQKGLNFTFSTDIGAIDLIGEVSGIGGYDEVIKYSETLEIYGMQCHVLTVEGLIKSKKAAGREKDRIVIKEMEALIQIKRRKENKRNN